MMSSMRIGWMSGGLALLFGVVAVVVWQAHRRWEEATSAMHQRLSASAFKAVATHYSASRLQGLPAPVMRYFRAVLKDGQPIVQRAQVTWKGEFNMGHPDHDKWVSFSAEQTFVPGAPGFVWNARMRMAPGVSAVVRDGFVEGEGSMIAKVAGVLTVARVSDTPLLAVGALQRYLGEAIWLPTALLPSQGVKWSPIDDTRARATLNAGRSAASLEFQFDSEGLIIHVYAHERVFDDGKNPPSIHPWQARILRYGEFHGMKVPLDGMAEWMLPSGAYAYWRGQPTHIIYEYASPAVTAVSR